MLMLRMVPWPSQQLGPGSQNGESSDVYNIYILIKILFGFSGVPVNLLVHTPASPATENGSEDESSGKTWLVQIITPALLESQRETRDLQDCRTKPVW